LVINISSEIAPAKDFNVNGLSPDINYCRIRVSDNGIGFDQKYSEKIFELFKRLHDKSYPGTGIGLAIVKKIAENHHGLVTANGTPGEGAIFDVYIPANGLA
jgi:signal transduction histidine kinase